MIDPVRAFEIAYALMARAGREAELFGDYRSAAFAAFERSCVCETFPELWFELPLKGDPWFDLHVNVNQSSLSPDMQFVPETTGGYPQIFEWFTTAPDARQLAISYDLHTSGIEHPAIQFLARRPSAHVPFLERAGGEEAVRAYRLFAERMPEGWYPCYTGLFPGREDAGVRVECIPRESLQNAYKKDPSLMEAHLRQAGIAEVGDTMIERCAALARTPYNIEFQFNVHADGSVEQTVGASVRFSDVFATQGAIGALLTQVERWGLADRRWRRLPDTIFSNRISHGDSSTVVTSLPIFLKLRWRNGEPVDAKTYLSVTATEG